VAKEAKRVPVKESQTAPEQSRFPIPMSRRALVLAVLLVVLVCILVEYGESVRGVELVSTALMLLVTSLLLALLAVNALLKRWFPKRRFSQAELLFVFVMLTVAGNIAGVGMMQFLVPLLPHIFHFTTPENKWGQFLPFIPDWMVPKKAVIEGFWRGQTTFFTWENIHGWLVPIIVWSLFVFAFISFMFCMNLLLRRQWIERERLAFPIVYFPLELTKEGGSLLRDKLLWVGFLIPVVLESLASLNYLYPAIPYLPLKPTSQLSLARFFGVPPTSPFANITLAFYPLALGIAYFVQVDVLFSAWFFYWFARLEELACIWLGFRGPEASAKMAEMPYLNQQSLGAFVALGLVAVWLARRHLAEAIVQVFKGKRGENQAAESASYRAALAGLLASGLFLVIFSLLIGISLPIVLLFFAIYFLTVLGYTRIRAEAGLPWAFGPNHPPHIFMAWGVGPVHIPTRSFVALNYYTWFDWDWRGTTMPYQMEGLKIASSANLKSRDMVKGILLASGIAIVASFIVLLTIYYRFGGESASVDSYRAQWGSLPTTLLRTWVESGANTNWAEIAGGGAGAAMVFLLAWLRSRWLWWPFHPVGYALSGTFTPQWLWCPLFLAWFAKSLILRYGGMRLYRRGIPFAVGLILGDYLVTAAWALAGMIMGRTMYTTFPS